MRLGLSSWILRGRSLVEFTDDQYRVELTKVDPGLPLDLPLDCP